MNEQLEGLREMLEGGLVTKEEGMKNSPMVRITMEGVDGYVEVTRWFMDALIFTTTDHQKYAEENYTDGSQKDKDDLTIGMRAIMDYMWPKDGEF